MYFKRYIIKSTGFCLATTSASSGSSSNLYCPTNACRIWIINLNRKILNSVPNILKKIAPEYGKYDNVIKVMDFKGADLKLIADIVSQKIICYFE